MSKLRDASKAVGRGSTGEALVLLWNELEPARLSGDEGTLADIQSLATAIAVRGDEGDRREAERLIEAVERYRGEGSGIPATARVEGDLAPAGEAGYGEPRYDEPGYGGSRYREPEQAYGEPPAEGYDTIEVEVPEGRGGRGGLGGLLWLVLLGAIVLFNLLGDLLNR